MDTLLFISYCVLTRSVLDVDWSMRLWSVDGDAKNKLKINIVGARCVRSVSGC